MATKDNNTINTIKRMKVKQLDHLGIIASVIDELRIVERIDGYLPVSDKSKVSMGERVKAFILNGLGFTDCRLYLMSEFFTDKPIERLFGRNIDQDELNDDALGRCLDRIYEYDATLLYAQLSFAIAKEHGLLDKTHRHDTTAFAVEGSYSYSPDMINYGYSKDHRPDLKQIGMVLTMSGSNNFPLWIESIAGNSSDKKALQDTENRVRKFRQQLADTPESTLVIADSALYHKELLRQSRDEVDFFWLTRVPETIKEAKMWCETDEQNLSWQVLDDNYKVITKSIEYENVKQRWQLVYSKEAHKKETATFLRNLDKERLKATNECKSLSAISWGCSKDIEIAKVKLQKKFKHMTIQYSTQEIMGYADKGRPKKNEPPIQLGYTASFTFLDNTLAISTSLAKKGRFIIGTNQLDLVELPDDNLLYEYKGQSKLERGFRYLKEPWFMANSLYIKNQERICALMMIMTLCLMVYNFAELNLRKLLVKNDDTLPNQLKKEVQNPTLKWVFKLMNCISILYLDGHDHASVLNDTQIKIVRYFGGTALKIYDINTEDV